MSRREEQRFSKQALEEALQAAGRAARTSRGACPEPETLRMFAAGNLEEQAATAVSTHVAACGLCDYIVQKSKVFEQAASESTPRGSLSFFLARRRLDRRFRDFLAHKGPEGKSMRQVSLPSALDYLRTVLAWLVHRPAFAYALVLLLLYPAYRGLFPRQRAVTENRAAQGIGAVVLREPSGENGMKLQPSRGSPGLSVASAPVLDLDAVRGGREEAPFAVSGDVFVLKFFVPIRLGYSYVARITSATGQSIGQNVKLQGPEGLGEFHLVCSRRLFSSGVYTLTVTEVDSKGSPTTRVTPYRFSM